MTTAKQTHLRRVPDALRRSLRWAALHPFTILFTVTAFLGALANGVRQTGDLSSVYPYVVYVAIHLRFFWGFMASTTPSSFLAEGGVPTWFRLSEAAAWGLLVGLVVDRLLRALVEKVVVEWGAELEREESSDGGGTGHGVARGVKRTIRWLVMHPMTVWSLGAFLVIETLVVMGAGFEDGGFVSGLILSQPIWMFMHYLNPLGLVAYVFGPPPAWLAWTSMPLWGLVFGLTVDRLLRWCVSKAAARDHVADDHDPGDAVPCQPT